MVFHELKPGWTFTKEWKDYSIDVNMPFSEMKEEESARIFFSGGPAPESIRYDRTLIRVTKHFFESNNPMASVCHGVEIPDYADCVPGRLMATVPKCRFYPKACGSIFVNEPCVVNSNLVSGRTYNEHGHYIVDWIRMLQAEAQPRRLQSTIR